MSKERTNAPGYYFGAYEVQIWQHCFKIRNDQIVQFCVLKYKKEFLFLSIMIEICVHGMRQIHPHGP